MSFQLNHFAGFSFNSELTTTTPTIVATDYYLNIVTSIAPQTWISGDYIQHGSSPNLANVNMRVNEAQLARLMGLAVDSDVVSAATGTQGTAGTPGAGIAAPSLGLSTTPEGGANSGFAFLEYAALRIFGHANARAAISNDTAFIANGFTAGAMPGTYTVVPSELPGAFGRGVAASLFSNSDANNQVFSLYVPLNKPELNSNDVFNVIPMNLNNTNWIFPVMFTGNIVASDGTVSLSALSGGVVGGIGNMAGGQYNIPVMVKITYVPDN